MNAIAFTRHFEVLTNRLYFIDGDYWYAYKVPVLWVYRPDIVVGIVVVAVHTIVEFVAAVDTFAPELAGSEPADKHASDQLVAERLLHHPCFAER